MKLGENFGDPIGSLKLRITKNGKNGGQCLTTEIDRLRVSYQTKPTAADLDPDFTTHKFSKSTDRLTYGIEYDVLFIPILSKSISVEECLQFMKEEKYLFVGPTLLPLIRCRKEVPKEIWITSLDVEKHFYEREGHKVFPCLKLEDEYFQIQLAIAFAKLSHNYVLACVKPAISNV